MHEASAGLQPGTRRGRRALGVGGVLYTLNTVGMIVYHVCVYVLIVSELMSFLAYHGIRVSYNITATGIRLWRSKNVRQETMSFS